MRIAVERKLKKRNCFGAIPKPKIVPIGTIPIGAVVVAQLAARSLPIPEDPGSNPVIGNFY